MPPQQPSRPDAVVPLNLRLLYLCSTRTQAHLLHTISFLLIRPTNISPLRQRLKRGCCGHGPFRPEALGRDKCRAHPHRAYTEHDPMGCDWGLKCGWPCAWVTCAWDNAWDESVCSCGPHHVVQVWHNPHTKPTPNTNGRGGLPTSMRLLEAADTHWTCAIAIHQPHPMQTRRPCPPARSSCTTASRHTEFMLMAGTAGASAESCCLLCSVSKFAGVTLLVLRIRSPQRLQEGAALQQERGVSPCCVT
jgi:hypothetical protein